MITEDPLFATAISYPVCSELHYYFRHFYPKLDPFLQDTGFRPVTASDKATAVIVAGLDAAAIYLTFFQK